MAKQKRINNNVLKYQYNLRDEVSVLNHIYILCFLYMYIYIYICLITLQMCFSDRLKSFVFDKFRKNGFEFPILLL